MNAIDVHTHIVPALIPNDSARDRLWPSVQPTAEQKAAVVVDGKPFRVVDSRCWDVSRRLEDMDREGVAIQVLSPMPELLSHWIAAPDASYLAEVVNETIAGMVAAAPDRFIGLGMVAMQDPSAAQKGIARIAELGLAGIEIGTHINGIPLGHEALWPIYESLETRDLSLFVHPLHPCGLDRMGAGEVGMIAAFPLEIAMAGISLMAAGIGQRFPQLRILLSHGGGALPSLLGRVEMARNLMPAIQDKLGGDAWQLAKHFWFDSNVYDPVALQAVAERFGGERLVVGSDYPFLIRQDHPGAFVEGAMPGTAAQCCANALNFLGRSSSR